MDTAAATVHPGAEWTGTYAGLVSRFFAYVLDALIVSVVSGAGAITLGLVASVIGDQARELARTIIATYVVSLPVLFAVYCAVFWLLAGRTPGMAALALRVVTVSGRPLRWYASVVRALLLAFFPIGALWLLANRRHRAVHDMIARTSVIRGA
jgi:uncharacterized RDD family membrane protein YckC